jgi:prepilin-type processing-associated H-X9-DG protein
MVLGILGFLPFCALIGMILGIVAINKINASNGQLKGLGMAITPLVLFIPMVMVSMALLFPLVARAREKARQTTCMSSQRQIAAAIQMYAQDHKGECPSDKTVWKDLQVEPDILICPTAGRELLNAYGYNQSISNKKIISFPDPTKVIVSADCANLSNLINGPQDMDFRHSKKAIASFVDGHVNMVSQDAFYKTGGYDPAK